MEFQNIADAEITTADAAKFINSQMKAFNITADDAESILDKVNETANNFAFGTDDIQKALTLSASSMKSYGNDINETIAILGANMELMPNKASQIGRAWNTIAANISKVSQSSDTWIAADGKVNVQLRTEEGELKSTYQILKELYPQWQKLTDEQKANLSVSVAGKNHQAKFTATMDNFGTAISEDADNLGIYQTALRSAGSASEENQKAMESLQGALNQLKAAWVELSQDLISGGTLTTFVKLATKVVNILDKMVNTIGGMPTLFLTVATSIGAVSKAFQLLDVPGKTASKLFGKIGIGGTTASKAMTTAAGAGAATEGAEEAVGLGSILSTAWKQRNYSADPTKLATKSLEKLTDAEKKVIEQSKVLEAAKKAESEATTNLTKKNFASSMAYYQATKAESGTMDDALKKRERLRNANEKVKVAEQELADATANVVEQEALLKKAQTDAEKDAGKLTAKLSTYSTTLMTLGATLAVIGLAVGLKKLGDAMGFESAVKDLKNTNSELKEVQERYDELEALGDNRTAAEEREYQMLKNELEVLKDQVERKKELVNLAYGRDAESSFEIDENGQLTTKSGLAGESTQTYTDMLASNKRAYTDLQKQWDEAVKNNDTVTMKLIDSQMSALETTIKENEDKVKQAYKDLANVDYEEQGETGKALFKDTISAYLQLAEGVDDYREALKLLPESESVTISMVDSEGNTINEDFSVKALLGLEDEELTQFINYVSNPDDNTKAFKEYLEEHPDGTAYKLFYDVIFGVEGKEDVDDAKNDAEKDGESTVTIKPTVDPKGEGDVQRKEAALTKGGEYKIGISLPGYQSVLKKLNKLISKGNKVKQGLANESATGKRKGEQGGLSWLGDEGSAQNPKPELVVGEDGAYLAGTGGWELHNLKSSDTVYTATQTKKLLAGNQTFSGAVGELPRYASGKKAKKQKAFDSALEKLEHKKIVNNWSDEYFQKKYKALYNKYKKWLSRDQKYAYTEAAEEQATDTVQEQIEDLNAIVEISGKKLTTLDRKIRKSTHLTSKEKKEALKEAYKAAVDYTKQEYEAGRKSWKALMNISQKYWKQVGKNSAEYYENLEELREAAEQREQDRLDYASTYLDYKIEELEREKEEKEELETIADLEQDIVDAENELAKAQNTMVRTFKDGKWVYDIDPEAVKEAQEALADAKEALADEQGDEIDQEIERLEAIKDTLDWESTKADLDEAGEIVGSSFVKAIKNMVNDTSTDWSTWASNLFGEIANLRNMSLSDLATYLTKKDSNGNYVNAFATGTLSASGGLSLVGEHGAELAWLGKGDSVYSNALSANLMQWGQYSPAQFEAATSGGTNQVFNISGITLPNVKDANSFIKEIQLLPNKAIQQSARR